MHIANAFRVGGGVYLPGFIGEDGDETAVSWIKIEMAFIWVVQIGLLKDKRHPQHAFPKIYRNLPRGAHNRDMVYTLCLDFFYQF